MTMSGGPWIQTWSGKAFDFMHPDPESICIEDIAHALSNLCRYTGHVPYPFSVAQHSLNVCKRVRELNGDDKAVRMLALLHDASEAYMGDVSAPLKRLLPAYQDLEHKIQGMIERKFIETEGVWFRVDDMQGVRAMVKRADLEWLATEAAVFHPVEKRPCEWSLPYPALDLSVYGDDLAPMKQEVAESLFLAAYEALR